MPQRVKVTNPNGTESWEDSPIFKKDVNVPGGVQGIDMNGFPINDGVHGGCYISASGATTITNPGTFYLLQGTTMTQNGFKGMSHASPGRLTYRSSTPHTIKADITLSLTCSANNVVVKIRLAKNGTSDPASEQSAKKTTGTDLSSLATQMLIQANMNDYFETFVTCDVQGATITSLTGTLLIVAV